MKISLENKNAMVCGASKGIGFAIAKKFSEMGANVTLLSRNDDNLKKAAAELSNDGNQTHRIIAGDFLDPLPIIEKIKRIMDEGVFWHILVNNSGGPSPGLITEAKPQDFLDAFMRHIIMSQRLMQLLLPGMKTAKYGRILNIISVSVKQPIENLGVSNTIRGAMNSWSKTLSREVAPFEITVNNILPGHTRTERLDALFEKNAETLNISKDDYAETIKSQIPAGRFGETEDIANLSGFLCSEKASFINGVNIQVDGGFVKGF
jgi:3-oxoacyl-[acyl-carrier protein] reductase